MPETVYSPYVSKFEDFLNKYYKKEIEKLAGIYPEKKSVDIDYNKLETFDVELADELILKPYVIIQALEEAIQQMSIATPDQNFKPHARICNLPRENKIDVRDINSDQINKFISIPGIITKITEVKPKIVMAVFECLHCGRIYNVPQHDLTGKLNSPNLCSCERKSFRLLEDQCVFLDTQRAEVQEPLESSKLRATEQAKTISIWLEDDLTGKLVPGDKIELTGIFRLKTPKHKGSIYDKFIHTNHLLQMQQEFEEIELTEEDEKAIIELSQDPKIYEKIVSSVAPSLYGMKDIKEAIALQLLGGTRNKVTPDGMRIRPDIHILLIGDPGCIVAGSKVVLGNGQIVNIESLGKTHLQKIRKQVLTGQGYNREYATCFHKYKRQQIIEIKTETGKKIAGTYNHPLLVVKNRKREWKRLDELKKGDRIASITSIPCTITAHQPTNWKRFKRRYGPKPRGKIPKNLNAELAGLLGYIFGDGWITKSGFAMLVNLEEQDLIGQLTRIINENFNLEARVRLRKPKNRKPITVIEFYDTDISKNLQFLREKKVPEIIFKSGNKQVAEFLSWLFEADGSVFSKGRGRRAIQLKSATPQILEDVQLLLLRFGIHSRINKTNLTIRQSRAISKFAKHIGFKSQKKKKRLKKLVGDCKDLIHKRKQKRSEKIVSIKKKGYADVYDIEIPKGHRFIANGIISHNTGKSRLLQYVQGLAPKGIYVSGKSSTGAGLCVSGDSTIILNNPGMVQIKEFVEEKISNPIEELPGAFSTATDFSVVTSNSSLKSSFGEGQKVWRIKSPKKLIKIKTQRGKELMLTPRTPFLTIKDGKIIWVKSRNINISDRVATSKKIPKLHTNPVFTISLIKNKNTRVVNNISNFVKKVTNRLIPSNGNLMNVARRYNLKRERLYSWRSKKQYSSMPLYLLKKMAYDAGFSVDEISRQIKTLSNRYGKVIKIPQTCNKNLLYFAGLIAGDGDIYRKNNRAIIRFHNSDPELRKRFMRLVKSLFGSKYLEIVEKERTPCVRMNSIVVAEILKEFGVPSGQKSAHLDIPKVLSSNVYLNSYISALFDTDGHVSKRKTNGSHSIGLTTTSKKLALKLQLILEQWGIISKIRTRDKRHYNGKIKTKKIQYALVITGKRNFELFKKHINFKKKNKARKLDSIIKSTGKSNPNIDVIPNFSKYLKRINEKYNLKIPKVYTRGQRNPTQKRLYQISEKMPDSNEKEVLLCFAKGDIQWDKIISKELVESKNDWVYDITVADSHSFFANGVLVHNTATAERDDFAEGGWTLKAGALVLAAGGMAMIDEFDKMGDEDRSSMHEAMEGQEIHVAKAGIVTTFKANAAILAGANPKFGRFDPYSLPSEQFNIPPTIMSRFDIIFPVKDTVDEVRDRELASYVLDTHTVAANYAVKGKLTDEMKKDEAKILPSINPALLRKYIAYARKNVHPILTRESIQKMEDFYLELRKMSEKQSSVAITARQLEAIVRLAEASAKGRLSPVVEIEDSDRAIRILKSYLKEIGVDPETGQFDIDIIATGTSKSKMDKVKTVYKTIKSLNNEYDEVQYDMIHEEVKNKGVKGEDLEGILQQLKRNGDIYSPRYGVYKPADEQKG